MPDEMPQGNATKSGLLHVGATGKQVIFVDRSIFMSLR